MRNERYFRHIFASRPEGVIRRWFISLLSVLLGAEPSTAAPLQCSGVFRIVSLNSDLNVSGPPLSSVKEGAKRFPDWLLPSIKEDRTPPLEYFSEIGTKRYLQSVASSKDYFQKLNATHDVRALFRGQALKAPLEIDQLKDLFFHPNRIFSSKSINNEFPLESPDPYHAVKAWSPEEVSALRAKIPAASNS